jgi:glycosyltransferase involved in cell wall biosynthesis
MRILSLVHNHSSLHPGGTELCAEALHRAYRRTKGVQATLLAGVDPATREGYPGTSITSDPRDSSTFFFRSPGFDTIAQSRYSLEPLLYELAWFLDERKPDLVHVHHLNHFGVECLRLVRRARPSAKIVFTLHDYYLICANDGLLYTTDGRRCRTPSPDACARCFPEHGPASFAARKIHIQNHLDLVDQFVAPSEFIRDRFVDWGIDRTKVTVINHGWSVNGSAKLNSVRMNRFALLGNLRETKGTSLIFSVFTELSKAGCWEDPPILEVYGAPLYQPQSFVEKLEEMVKEAGGAIQMHGAYEHTDVARLLSGSAWVLVPSLWWENAPLVVQEAFALKRPVLCSDIGGMAEFVRHKETGLHVRAGDIEAWKSAIQQTSGNQALWSSLSGAIQPPRTPKDMASDYLKLFSLAEAA